MTSSSGNLLGGQRTAAPLWGALLCLLLVFSRPPAAAAGPREEAAKLLVRNVARIVAGAAESRAGVAASETLLQQLRMDARWLARKAAQTPNDGTIVVLERMRTNLRQIRVGTNFELAAAVKGAEESRSAFRTGELVPRYGNYDSARRLFLAPLGNPGTRFESVEALRRHLVGQRFSVKYADEVARAFDFSQPVELVVAEDAIELQRVFGKGAAKVGRWYSEESVARAVEKLALPPKNAVTGIAVVEWPKGTPFIRGRVAAQPGWNRPGGGTQLFVTTFDSVPARVVAEYGLQADRATAFVAAGGAALLILPAALGATHSTPAAHQ